LNPPHWLPHWSMMLSHARSVWPLCPHGELKKQLSSQFWSLTAHVELVHVQYVAAGVARMH